MELLNKNLDNIPEAEKDLFGNKIEKLSMKDRIGFVPISIWQPDWEIVKKLKDIIGDTGQGRINSGKNTVFGNENREASIFNPHLCQMLLSAYCPLNAKIFDPFAGDHPRGFIASAMKHEYTGIEIRQEECNTMLKTMSKLNLYFKIICGDCRDYNIEENYYDFSYTCPPYYDLEIYSNLNGDLSNFKTYEEFLDGIKQSLMVVFKGLKLGCLSIWVVGNFRAENGNLRHFNGDLVRLGLEIGFDLWDELIFWGASKSAAQRSGQFEANRKSVRVHEYIIIFKKTQETLFDVHRKDEQLLETTKDFIKRMKTKEEELQVPF